MPVYNLDFDSTTGLTSTTNLITIASATSLAFAPTPALNGLFRLSNGTTPIMAIRNATNTADLVLLDSSSTTVALGGTTSAGNRFTNIAMNCTGSFTVLNGAGNAVALTGNGGDFINLGSTTGTVGFVRVSNNANICVARNAANSGNMILLATDASNVVLFGDANNAGITTVCGGNYIVKSGTHFFENAAGSASFLTTASTSVGFGAPVKGIQVQNIPYALGYLTKVWPSDADYTFANTEYINPIIEVTGGSLSAPRNGILPAQSGAYFTVFNNTSGAQTVTFKVTGLTGVTVANGKRATIYCNGTDYVRATADV